MRARLLLLAAACACSDPAPAPIRHEVFTHVVDAERTGLATGRFEEASLVHGSIAVDPKYKHVLNFQVTPMLPPLREAIASSGPLILYSNALEVIVFSPLDHFYESLIWMEAGAIHYGVAGEIDAVPAGFTHTFILVEGTGINRTIETWGALVRGDRPAPDRYADRGLSHLGYWTDNGAYYYYRTEDGLNEEDTMLAVAAEARTLGVPYGYLQLDSWWYFKAPGSGLNPWGGVTRWEPQPEQFPDGLAAFQQRLGLPLIVHNRWFAPENDYRDEHPFVADSGPEMTLPASGAIFGELMRDAKSWGAFTYEQDWLIPQFWGVPHLRNGVGHTSEWMRWIDEAARAESMTVQITMAGAAHLMDAVARPSVTTVRTSIDYAPAAPKTSFWPQFHVVNLLAGALVIWPFKDNFHSSEPWGEEEALISVLSAGMVGAGDRIGATRADILLRTCRSDGVLLKPDRPATPLDAMFLPHARPYLTSTYSDHAAGRWHYVAAYHIERGAEERRNLDDFHAAFAYSGTTLEQMFFMPERIERWDVDLEKDLGVRGPAVVYDWQAREATVASSIELRPTADAFRHRFVVVAPVLENGLALIGEPAKYVTLADRRFSAVTAAGDAVHADLTGAPGEAVTVLAYDTRDRRMLPEVTVTLDGAGAGRVELTR